MTLFEVLFWCAVLPASALFALACVVLLVVDR